MIKPKTSDTIINATAAKIISSRRRPQPPTCLIPLRHFFVALAEGWLPPPPMQPEPMSESTRPGRTM